MLKNIAVLIDADNIGGQKIDWIFDKINSLGNIGTKRIYGDFAKPHLSSWENYILKYAIEKKHQTSYSSGKNSSDIALAIDAIDLWHTGEFDGFCIISSDSDFIGLALRLRRNNIQAFGFGEYKTIKEFRQVCTQFFEIPNDNNTQTQKIEIQNTKPTPIKKYTTSQLKCDTRLLNALRDSINSNKADEDGWVNYAIFVSYFQKTYPNINTQNYGYDKLYEIIDNIDIFEGKKENSTIFIRIQPSKSTQNSSNNQQWSAEKLSSNDKLINAIKDSIANNLENGWANFSPFTQYLNQNYPKMKPKNYGYGKWRTLIDKIELFETKQVNKTTLFIREKAPSNSTTKTTNKKIENNQLLNDILEIINENTKRTDEWVHIGHLGSQLKQKGYNAKDFGYKTITLLLRNLKGVKNKIVNNTDYFTLTDKSKIKPIAKTEPNQQPIEQPLDFKETALYRLLLRNQEKLNAEINKLLLQKSPLKLNDFWSMLEKQLPADYLLANNQSYPCFVQFFKHQLPAYQLIDDNGHLLIFGKE